MRTFVLIILIVGGIFLQIFLSKKENKWCGLILPLICVGISLLAVLGNIAFSFLTMQGELSLQEIAPDGTVLNETVTVEKIGGNPDIGAMIVQIVAIFVIFNIPTAILLVIYSACRENMNKNKQVLKMNIQDLE